MDNAGKLFFHYLIYSFQSLFSLKFNILRFWTTLTRFARLRKIITWTRLWIVLCNQLQLLIQGLLEIAQNFLYEILPKVYFHILRLWLVLCWMGRTSIISLLRAMLASNSLFLRALMHVTVSISSTSLTFYERVKKIIALRVSGSLEPSKDYFIDARYFWVG